MQVIAEAHVSCKKGFINVTHRDESTLEKECQKCKNRVASDHVKETGLSMFLRCC